MSTLYSNLERAASALNCSSKAGYSSQVAVAFQQQQHQSQHINGIHSTTPTSSETSLSPTLQMSSQSPLSSIVSISSSPPTSSSVSVSQQHQSLQSPTHPSSNVVLANGSQQNNASNNSKNTNNGNVHSLSPITNGNGLVEDQRALQLAFELSMVGLSDTIAAPPPSHLHQQHHQQQQQLVHQHHQQSPEQQQQSNQHHSQIASQSTTLSLNSYGDLGSVVLTSQQLLQQQQQQSTTNGMNLLNNNLHNNGGSLIGLSNGNGSAAATGLNGVTLSSVLAVSQQQQLQQQQPSQHSIGSFASILPPGIDDRSKKSQNMTECVPVPSSEHVAEIVGRQGCKIKALRAKTNTYIKTPVRGEEPVFVVTGRKEDVGKAKREILSAAEHFSLIRASRKPTLSGLGGKGSPPGPPTNIPGQVTIQVRVPYRVVGLVVGPKGATIKHIQQQTHTYIVTPSRDKEPIFEVTGMPDNVQSARRQIEAHIALRTGNIAIAAAAATTNGQNATNSVNGTAAAAAAAAANMNGLGSLLSDDANSEFLASLYKNGFGSLLGYLDPALGGTDQTLPPPNGTGSLHHQLHQTSTNAAATVVGLDTQHHSAAMQQQHQQPLHHHHHHHHQQQQQQSYAPVLTTSSTSTGGSRSCSSSSSSTSSKSATRSQPELINIWKSLGDSIDIDEGLGESPNIWNLPAVTSALGSRCSPSTSVSPTDSLLGGAGGSSNSSSSNTGTNGNGGSTNNTNCNILAANAAAAAAALCRRECLVCGDKEVTAALVPCGHNMFCMDCATRVSTSNQTATDGICPVCSQTVIQAIRIIP